MRARLLTRAMAVQAVERYKRTVWELPLRWRSSCPSGTGQLLSLAIVGVAVGRMDAVVWQRCGKICGRIVSQTRDERWYATMEDRGVQRDIYHGHTTNAYEV